MGCAQGEFSLGQGGRLEMGLFPMWEDASELCQREDGGAAHPSCLSLSFRPSRSQPPPQVLAHWGSTKGHTTLAKMVLFPSPFLERVVISEVPFLPVIPLDSNLGCPHALGKVWLVLGPLSLGSYLAVSRSSWERK